MPKYTEKAEMLSLPVIPLRGIVAFPSIPISFEIERSFSVSACEAALDNDMTVLLVAQKDPACDEPEFKDVHKIGCVARIKQSVKTPEDIIRVMKKYVPRISEEKTYRHIDSGIVTHGNKDNAINMVLLAKKYAVFQNSLSATELISMVVGAVLAAVLAFGDMFILPATLLALWQVVWCAVLYVRSKLTFQRRKEREDNEEQ